MTDSNNTVVAPYSTQPRDHTHTATCWQTYYSCAMERIAWLERQLEKVHDEDG